MSVKHRSGAGVGVGMLRVLGVPLLEKKAYWFMDFFFVVYLLVSCFLAYHVIVFSAWLIDCWFLVFVCWFLGLLVYCVWFMCCFLA